MESPHRPRWARFTPDGCVSGLLALVCLLFLSDRFQWFGASGQKGWGLFVAVTIAGAMALVLTLLLVASLFLRWRFQFGIRSLLMLAVVVAVLCGWFVSERIETERQRQAVSQIDGGSVVYDYERDALGNEIIPRPKPPGPAWLRNLVGEDFFARVVGVHFRMPRVTDDSLAAVAALAQPQGIAD